MWRALDSVENSTFYNIYIKCLCITVLFHIKSFEIFDDSKWCGIYEFVLLVCRRLFDVFVSNLFSWQFYFLRGILFP